MIGHPKSTYQSSLSPRIGKRFGVKGLIGVQVSRVPFISLIVEVASKDILEAGRSDRCSNTGCSGQYGGVVVAAPASDRPAMAHEGGLND